MCKAQHDEHMQDLEVIAKIADGAVMDVSHGDQRKAVFAINKIINIAHARIRYHAMNGAGSEAEG